MLVNTGGVLGNAIGLIGSVDGAPGYAANADLVPIFSDVEGKLGNAADAWLLSAGRAAVSVTS